MCDRSPGQISYIRYSSFGIVTVPRPIDPKHRSIEALPIVYPTNHQCHDSNHRRHFSKPISAITPPPCNSTRSEPASYPIVIPLRKNHAIEQRYLSSHSAYDSDHRNAVSEPPFVESPYDCSTPSAVPVSTSDSLLCHMNSH